MLTQLVISVLPVHKPHWSLSLLLLLMHWVYFCLHPLHSAFCRAYPPPYLSPSAEPNSEIGSSIALHICIRAINEPQAAIKLHYAYPISFLLLW